MDRWVALCLLLVSLLITPALPAFADETASAVQSAEAPPPDPLGVATMAKDPTIALTFV